MYRLTEEGTGEFVVGKVSSSRKMLEREGEVLRRMKHPLFPGYKGMCAYENKTCLLMEYIEGRSLEVYVKRRGGLSGRRSIGIARELAEGLCYLHEQSEAIVYRDIKPENVMIQSDGRARLIDLGCVHVEGLDGCGMAGSRGYAAPEQFDAGKQVGAESDVYGLGKLLYFMLTGQNMGAETGGKAYFPAGQKLDRKMKWLISQAVKEKQQCRIPDMRTFLQYLELYEESAFWKSVLFGRRRLRQMKRAAFHFRKNIRKGM